eukprot:1960162-Lingulodinium_polyedra.AAC.1
MAQRSLARCSTQWQPPQPPGGLQRLQHRGRLRRPGKVLTCQKPGSSFTFCSRVSRCHKARPPISANARPR